MNEVLRRWVEDPENFARVAKITLDFLELLAKRIAAGESRLALLLQKSDQAILREIRAAFQALSDATATNSPETRERLLTLAEENLYNNTGLESSLTTGDHPNSYWMAQAHYGLAVIYALRGDAKMVTRSTLRIFTVDPRQGRKELVPELYEEMFRPNCAEVFSWHKARLLEVERTNFSGKVLRKKLLAGGVGLGGIAGAIALTVFSRSTSGSAAALANQASKSAKEIWNDATPETFRIEAIENLNSEMEQRIDERCRELAIEALSLA